MTATTTTVALGDVLTCAETGAKFVAARDGFTTNYALTRDGQALSDEGVDIRDRRELLTRDGPFACYLSSDCATVTGWKGNVLGHVTRATEARSGWHGSRLTYIRATDVHGGEWHGKGAGGGMLLRLHPCKS